MLPLAKYRAVNDSAPAYLSSYFTRVTDVPSRQETPVDFHQPTCSTAVEPLHLWETGFCSFRRHLLEQFSTTRDICIVARDILTTS